MNEVSLCGMRDLASADRKKIVNYVMDKKHWTFGGVKDKIRKKSTKTGEDEEDQSKGGVDTGVSNAASNLSIVVKPKEKQRFVIPVPGKSAPKGSLSGKKFVITGVFPEVGGGEGLQLGKDRVKKMITAFGGKVSSSVSGRTDILVVGKDPGFSKVLKARKNPRTRLLGLHDMKTGLERGSLEEAKAKPMLVRSFSKGYGQRRGGPNGLARTASKQDLALASGDKPLALRGNASKRTLTLGFLTKKRPAGTLGATSKRRKV